MISQHLLLRLLNTPRRYRRGAVTLTFDKLPNHLPIELPIINQANVVTSVSYGNREFYIFLDIPQAPQKIQITYRNALLGKGWRMLRRNKAESYAGLGLGFSNRFPSNLTEPTTYCNRSQNALLRLTTSPSENSITQATLKLDLSYSSCQAGWEQDSRLNNIPIPIFIEPPQTEITKSLKNGGGDGLWNSIAIITTHLERRPLIKHYYSQMEEMSWNCIAAAENNLLSTSLWELQDSNNTSWRGVFKWGKIANNRNQYVADLEVIEQSSIEAYFSSAIQTSLLNCEQIPEDLAQRILEHVLEVNTAESQLLVSKLPPQLPIKLSLFDNTEIIGSLYTDGHFRILLEVPEFPERVELFYQQQLSSGSWEKCEIPPRISKQSGFMSSGYKPFEMNIFCHKESGWELFFNTHPSQPNHTDLRLEIRRIAPDTFCAIHPAEDVSLLNQESQDDVLEALIKQISLPVLIAPEKAEVLFLNPIGGSGIQYSHKRDGQVRLGAYFSNAFVKTQSSTEDLAAHYFNQMPKYGWKEVSEIKQGKIAVGLWTFQNEQGDTFQAAIAVIQNQNSRQQYSANLRIVPFG